MDAASPTADVTLLVAASGSGSRLGLGPKAFLTLGEKTLLEWVVWTGRWCAGSILVAVPPGMRSRAREQLRAFPDVQVFEGGRSRQESYTFLLQHCDTPFVLIRDVARPLVSTDLLQRVADAARSHRAAGAFGRVSTPVGLRLGDSVVGALASEKVAASANPQAFETQLLRNVIDTAGKAGVERQTLWELVVEAGQPLYIVDDEPGNVKITDQYDWEYVRDVVFPRWLLLHENDSRTD